MEPIAFTKVKLPYGWMSNMSNHHVELWGVKWPSAEHAFQVGRLSDDHEMRLGGYYCSLSPMDAKRYIYAHHSDSFVIEPKSQDDVDLMAAIVGVKIEQNGLLPQLMETGDRHIIEDVTKRYQRGNNSFWGAALIDGQWVGANTLGKIWMSMRDNGGKGFTHGG